MFALLKTISWLRVSEISLAKARTWEYRESRVQFRCRGNILHTYLFESYPIPLAIIQSMSTSIRPSCLMCHQGIPSAELWECRKNALTDQLRHYLDSGRVPGENQDDHQSSRDNTQRPTNQISAYSTERAKATEQTGGGVVRNSSATALLFMASLFGDGHEDKGDY